MELANSSGTESDSLARTLHILACLGRGIPYFPYKSKPSSMDLLRARQGFIEQIGAAQSAWSRGVISDSSAAFVCSAALFEELTAGWESGVQVLSECLTKVLPERKSQSYELEYVFCCYLRMLKKHHEQAGVSKILQTIQRGLQTYPFNPELLASLVELSHLYITPNKLRQIFDAHFQKKPSVMVWLFALSFEISRGGSQHRVHGLFERALTRDRLCSFVVLWRCYIAYEINVVGNLQAAKRVFFRAVHACPWSKTLWLDGFLKLTSVLTVKELSDLQEVMRDKELNLRTDIYEILLQDEFNHG